MKKNEKIKILNELKKQAFQRLVSITECLSEMETTSGTMTISAVVVGDNVHYVGMDVESVDKCVREMIAANDVKINPVNNKPFFNLYIGRINGIGSQDSNMEYFEFDNWLSE